VCTCVFLYSRIPVFEGAIDRIVGVALSKDLLDFISDPSALETVTVSNGFRRLFPTLTYVDTYHCTCASTHSYSSNVACICA
jgi:hypothetical protein